MSVERLQREFSSRELAEWMAYDRIEPLHDPYWIGGMICATMANLWGSKRYDAADFMPAQRAGEPAVQSSEQGIARMNAMIARQQARGVE